ncbi:hypothetical protein DEU56DRAFT_756160 [Suillus clintonianus]|uniref:uncharacterized protein n=1 Tax=Suillus clintonianus TaxID=1904413 RepID=UPI001B865E20|nr:uncharacterized protein DEU56DRAFT_756160 [Suillus clintonianus]KAG2137032.1 hypothetical protein DEU56DRAFT_756160 [Suillus clintonianus]
MIMATDFTSSQTYKLYSLCLLVQARTNLHRGDLAVDLVSERSSVPAAASLAARLDIIHDELRAELQFAQDAQAKHYNKKVARAPEFQPGQLVPSPVVPSVPSESSSVPPAPALAAVPPAAARPPSPAAITVSPYIIAVASIYACRGFVSLFLVESTPVTGPILAFKGVKEAGEPLIQMRVKIPKDSMVDPGKNKQESKSRDRGTTCEEYDFAYILRYTVVE